MGRSEVVRAAASWRWRVGRRRIGFRSWGLLCVEQWSGHSVQIGCGQQWRLAMALIEWELLEQFSWLLSPDRNAGLRRRRSGFSWGLSR